MYVAIDDTDHAEDNGRNRGTGYKSRALARELIDLVDGRHLSITRQKVDLQLVPFLDTVLRGVFATRSPGRPNLLRSRSSAVLAVDGATIRVAGVDLLKRNGSRTT